MDTLKDKNNVYDSYLTSDEAAHFSNHSTTTTTTTTTTTSATSATMLPSIITTSSSVLTLEETDTPIQRNLSMGSTLTTSLLNLITILCLAYLL